MSPDIREIEDKLSRLESEPDRDRDEPGDRELSDRQADHLDKILDQLEDSAGERGDRLAEVSEQIHAEKTDESPEERRARRNRHELTPGEKALLDLLTGGSGEVKRR